MNIRRGDIFYIKRGENYQGNEIAKDRPGIIVSADHLNAGESCVEVVFITTQPKREMKEHVLINSTGRVSTALCEQIYSITVQRIGNYIGMVSDQEMKEIDMALAASVGLSFTKKEEDDSQDELLRMRTERDTYRQMYERLLDRMAR